MSIAYFAVATFIGLIASIGEEKNIFLLSFTQYFVVSVRMGFLFLLVLGIGFANLKWNPEWPSIQEVGILLNKAHPI